MLRCRDQRCVELSNPRGLLEERGLIESNVSGFTLDREQKLMKLSAHPPFGRTIVEVAQSPLETAQRPIECQFWMLFHSSDGPMTPSSMPARPCAARHAAAPLACQVLAHGHTIHVGENQDSQLATLPR